MQLVTQRASHYYYYIIVIIIVIHYTLTKVIQVQVYSCNITDLSDFGELWMNIFGVKTGQQAVLV